MRREFSRVRRFEALLPSLDPHLVTIDYELHAAVVTGAALDVPILLSIVWFTIFRHPGLVPMEFRAHPASDSTGRARLGALWLSSVVSGLFHHRRRHRSIQDLRIRMSQVLFNTMFICGFARLVVVSGTTVTAGTARCLPDHGNTRVPARRRDEPGRASAGVFLTCRICAADVERPR